METVGIQTVLEGQFELLLIILAQFLVGMAYLGIRALLVRAWRRYRQGAAERP